MSQLTFVKNHLDKYGEISRNYCLQNFITRLAGRINDLKKLGYEFEKEKRGGDYVYKIKRYSPPPVQPQYRVEVINPLKQLSLI